MTEVQFHFNVPDRLGYACRLLRKAVRQGAEVAVTAAPAELDGFDRLLWTFADAEFIPHLRLQAGASVPAHLQRTPVWLVERADQAERFATLVQLGDEPAPGYERFERLIEIVGSTPGERESGRRRWRHYASRGYPITRHEVGA